MDVFRFYGLMNVKVTTSRLNFICSMFSKYFVEREPTSPLKTDHK